jgi:hypothetical protein
MGGPTLGILLDLGTAGCGVSVAFRHGTISVAIQKTGGTSNCWCVFFSSDCFLQFLTDGFRAQGGCHDDGRYSSSVFDHAYEYGHFFFHCVFSQTEHNLKVYFYLVTNYANPEAMVDMVWYVIFKRASILNPSRSRWT